MVCAQFGRGVSIVSKLAHKAVVNSGRAMPQQLRRRLVKLFNDIDASHDGVVTIDELLQAASSGQVPEQVLQIASEDEDGLLTLSEWLSAWETSAEVLRYEIEQFKDGTEPGNTDGGHLALSVHMTESQRARIPDICKDLGVGWATHGVGSTTTIIVTKDPADAEKIREEEEEKEERDEEEEKGNQ